MLKVRAFCSFSHHPTHSFQDYHTLLSQLEHAFSTSPSFTLQKLWFYVHPTLHTLSLLYSLVTEIAQADDPDGDSSSEVSSSSSDAARNEELGLGSGLKAVLSEMQMGGGGVAKGGEVVAVIWDRMTNMSGDPTAHQLYRKLLRAASLPYAQMLQRWIRTGHLKDPCEELMVKESKFINRGTLEMDYTDEYWERRYTVRSDARFDILGFLTRLIKAARWIESLSAIEEASSGCTTTANAWWTTTRRRLRTPLHRGMEAQDPPGREVS